MSFEKLFKEYYWIVEEKAKRFSDSLGEDMDDLVSYMQLQFWLEWKEYDPSKKEFKNFIDFRLNQRLLDFINKRQRAFARQAKRFSELEEVDDEGNSTPFEFEDAAATAEIEEFGEKKTDEDKQQLINALIKNADSLTTAIVNEFLSDDNATPTAIGKKLGVHHQTVRRKLDALARKYYANHDEDINEYLAV